MYQQAVGWLPGWDDAAILTCELGRLILAIEGAREAEEQKAKILAGTIATVFFGPPKATAKAAPAAPPPPKTQAEADARGAAAANALASFLRGKIKRKAGDGAVGADPSNKS